MFRDTIHWYASSAPMEVYGELLKTSGASAPGKMW